MRTEHGEAAEPRNRLPGGGDGSPCAKRWPEAQGGPHPALPHAARGEGLEWARYFTIAAPALAITSSCEPVPPDTPIAPISLPPSISGMPPREAITSSSVMM